MKLTLSRIERWIWYAFLVSAPWQTRLIVWQADRSFIEWRSAAVYLSDVLMGALVVCALIRLRGRIRFTFAPSDWLLALLFAAALLSLPNAPHIGVGVYALGRLLQFMVLFLYLRYWAWHRFDADRSAVAFVAGAAGQAVLGIAQYILQHDMGLRWLGETLLQTDMRGVAVFYDVAQHKVLRAYGTFPHPNVMATYLAASLWITVWLWLRHAPAAKRGTLMYQAAFSLILIGLYLTFSRTVIAVWALASCVLGVIIVWGRVSNAWANMKEVRRRLRTIAVTTVIVSAGVLLILWPQMVARLTISSTDEAVQQRVRYNQGALATGSSANRTGWYAAVNWTGVGIGNFTTWLDDYDRTLPAHAVQPAHNIFLLAYSEIGVLGLTVWLSWLVSVFAVARSAYRGQPLIRVTVIALAVSFVLIGSLDHFFWTLQQGRILWWAVLALAAGKA